MAACFLSYVSLNQYLTARIHELTNKWYLPRSPYTLESSVGRPKSVYKQGCALSQPHQHTEVPYFSTIQSDWLDLRIKHFERGLPCHFTKITQNSDTVACCSFTFSCQEANTLTDTKFSCKRIAEVGITINNFYFIPSRNRFSFLPRNPPFLNTMTSDFSVLMDKECSLHTEFKWLVCFVTQWKYLTRALNHPQTAAKIVQLSQVEVEYHVSRLPPCQSQLHLQTRKREQDSEYTPV